MNEHDDTFLRDWFAGMAMQGTLANDMAMKGLARHFHHDAHGLYAMLSRDSYDLADAMLEERRKKDGTP